MAQAANVIPLRDNDRKHSEAFRDLEADICDLMSMAQLTVREVESVLEEVAPGTEAYERGNFAVIHLREMIGQLKARYYAGY
jgi:K+/H+ antiporter YhaU regulatory subunit KhtT